MKEIPVELFRLANEYYEKNKVDYDPNNVFAYLMKRYYHDSNFSRYIPLINIFLNDVTYDINTPIGFDIDLNSHDVTPFCYAILGGHYDIAEKIFNHPKIRYNKDSGSFSKETSSYDQLSSAYHLSRDKKSKEFIINLLNKKGISIKKTIKNFNDWNEYDIDESPIGLPRGEQV